MIMFILGAIGGWAGSHYFSSLGLALALPFGLLLKRYLTWSSFLFVAIGLLVGTMFMPTTMFIGGVSHNNFFTTLVVINAVGTPLLWLIGGAVYAGRKQKKQSQTDRFWLP